MFLASKRQRTQAEESAGDGNGRDDNRKQDGKMHADEAKSIGDRQGARRWHGVELRTQNSLFRSVRPGDSTLRLVRVAIMRVTLCDKCS